MGQVWKDSVEGTEKWGPVDASGVQPGLGPIADPVALQDAVTKAWALALVTGNAMGSVPTIAALAALPGPSATGGLDVFVDEFNAIYHFVAGSVAVADNVAVVSPTGGVAGRFLLQSAGIAIRPIDGTTADEIRIAACVNALAGKGWVMLLPGLAGEQFQIKSNTTLLGTFWIIGTAATVVNSRLPLNGLNINVVFNTVQTADVSVTSTTLAATPAQGSTTVSSNGTVAVGKYIRIAMAAAPTSYQTFKVLAVAGGGPFTLTLDEAVLFPFLVGDAVTGRIPSLNPRIDGFGMQIIGTAARVIEFTGTIGAWISGLRIDGAWDWGIGSYDLGGRDNIFNDIRGSNNTVTGGAGLALEGQVGSSIINCNLRELKTTGVFISSCRLCAVHNVNVAIGLAEGIRIDTQVPANDPTGCQDIAVSDSTFIDCGTYGGLVTDQSSRISFVNCVTRYAGTAGFCADVTSVDVSYSNVAANSTSAGPGFLGQAGIVAAVTSYSGCTARDNNRSGFKISASSVIMSNCAGSGNGAGATGTSGNVELFGSTALINGWISSNPLSTADLYITGTSKLFLSNASLVASRAFATYSILADGTNGGVQTIEVNGFTLAASNAGSKLCFVSTAAAIARYNVSNIRVDGATEGADLQAGSTFRRGCNVVYTNTGTVYVNPGAPRYSFGTVVANGVTGVDVAFSDITADDRIVFTLRTIGGTVGHPKYTITAGTKFTLTSDAADTSTYEYWIE